MFVDLVHELADIGQGRVGGLLGMQHDAEQKVREKDDRFAVHPVRSSNGGGAVGGLYPLDLAGGIKFFFT